MIETIIAERITINPQICHGKPSIRGLRYPVEMILELLSSGMSIEEILTDYEDLEREDILAALAFATQLSKVKSMHSMATIRPKPNKSTSDSLRNHPLEDAFDLPLPSAAKDIGVSEGLQELFLDSRKSKIPNVNDYKREKEMKASILPEKKKKDSNKPGTSLEDLLSGRNQSR
jgi:uncharacterized protein (DUF433 family)